MLLELAERPFDFRVDRRLGCRGMSSEKSSSVPLEKVMNDSFDLLMAKPSSRGRSEYSDRVASQESEATGGKAAGTKESVLSVTDLNKAIKSQLEGNFSQFWVQGEISNFKAHSSGHFYFSLKDKTSQIRAVMFRGYNGQLKFRPEDGMEVIVRGRISVYEPRGDYQVLCEVMEPVGAGALQKAFEQLKRKLAQEGLFDQARKKPIPQFPQHVAIVTSPTGAAIQDMINILGRRCKSLRITLIPTTVQGPQAPGEIVAALGLADWLPDADVIIVGRGGGSIEDLWAFNDERVARAISACRLPTISAVGHEVDFTIADFVADLRAPTPSAAAELVAKSSLELLERIDRLQRTISLVMRRKLEMDRRHLANIAKRLIHPGRRLQDLRLRCDELTNRLEYAFKRYWKEKKNDLLKLGALLDTLSPLRVVDRGYSIVTVGTEVVKSSQQLSVGTEIELRFARGGAAARITSVKSEIPKE